MNVARIGCEQDLEQLQFAEPAFNEAALLRDLVEADVVAPDAIKEVLAYRKKHGTDLLDTIEQLGLVAKSKRPALVARQLGIPVVHIDGLTVEPSVLGSIPAEVAIKHRVFPLAQRKITIFCPSLSPK